MPLLPVTIAFATGIALILAGVNLTICLIPVISAVALALSGRRYFAAVAIAVSLGAVDTWLAGPDDSTSARLAGTVYARVDVATVHESETSRALTVVVRQTGIDSQHMLPIEPTKVRISIPSFLPVVSPGDRVTIKCTFDARPNIEHVPDQLNLAAIRARQGIAAQAVAKPEDIADITSSPALRMKCAAMRGKVVTLILRSGLNGPTKEFLVTTITGSGEYIDSDVRAAFAGAGIAHVLALSGLHVGILAAFCSLLFLPLMLFEKTRRVVPLCIVIVLWVFAFVTGLSPSVARAVIMATALIGATLLQRRHSAWNSLCLAALAILVFDPLALLSVSFQLSFAAVAGILAFGNALNPVSPRRRRLYKLVGLLTMSTGAMLATALLSTYYFHVMPVWFLPANILAVPLLTPLVGGGMLLVLLECLGIPAGWLCSCLDALYACVACIARVCNNLPGAHIDGVVMPVATLIAGSCATAAFAILLHTRRRVYAAMTGICAAAAVALMFIAAPAAEANGVYIAPFTYRTDIIVSSREGIGIITTAPPHEHDEIAATAKILYSDFMLRRSIDSVAVWQGDIHTRHVRYNYPLLTAGHNTVYIADSRTVSLSRPIEVDNLLVCRGFTGTIAGISRKVKAKRVILSADLHPARHKKYAEECGAMRVECLSLKERPAGNLLATD